MRLPKLQNFVLDLIIWIHFRWNIIKLISTINKRYFKCSSIYKYKWALIVVVICLCWNKFQMRLPKRHDVVTLCACWDIPSLYFSQCRLRQLLIIIKLISTINKRYFKCSSIYKYKWALIVVVICIVKSIAMEYPSRHTRSRRRGIQQQVISWTVINFVSIIAKVNFH
jgi:hypothetical protein